MKFQWLVGTPSFLTTQEAIEALQKVADAVGGTIREDYSGRGMYGATCYGIVCDYETACIEEAAEHGIRGANTDSMGKGAIVYWPRISKDAKRPNQLVCPTNPRPSSLPT